MYEPEYRLNGYHVENMTTAMTLVCRHYIPQKCWEHDPKL